MSPDTIPTSGKDFVKLAVMIYEDVSEELEPIGNWIGSMLKPGTGSDDECGDCFVETGKNAKDIGDKPQANENSEQIEISDLLRSSGRYKKTPLKKEVLSAMKHSGKKSLEVLGTIQGLVQKSASGTKRYFESKSDIKSLWNQNNLNEIDTLYHGPNDFGGGTKTTTTTATALSKDKK